MIINVFLEKPFNDNKPGDCFLGISETIMFKILLLLLWIKTLTIFFMYLLTIWISPFGKCLLKSFAYLLIGLFILFKILYIFWILISWLMSRFQTDFPFHSVCLLSVNCFLCCVQAFWICTTLLVNFCYYGMEGKWMKMVAKL
jgi:hypothetical protein